MGEIMKPSVGRVVHFVSGEAKCRAAIVTEVKDDGRVTLFVMSPGFQRDERNVPELGSDDVPPGRSYAERTWHWPERVE